MNANDQTLISVNNVSRFYDTICAVDSLSFDVKRGEVVGLLGPNGAGKSTTLQMLSGNLAPTNGEIAVNNYDLFENPKQAKMQLGYLPDKPPLYPEFTVREYLLFCARLNRISNAMQQSALDSAINRCGLETVTNKLIHNLSKGYQQRVGIAQAILHSPQVIILDEPTVGLDPIQIREIRHLIRELRNDHSIILSTHILPEVITTCDRVLLINQGKVIIEESTEKLKQRMESSSLMIAMHNPPTMETLLSIKDIDHVEKAGQDKFRFHYTCEQSPAEQIIQLAVENQWRLYEITPERISLEDVFVNLTTKENNIEEAVEQVS